MQKAKKLKRKIHIRPLYIVISVALLIYSLSTLAPFYFIFINSLKKPLDFYSNPWGLPTIIYMKNYRDAIKLSVEGVSLAEMYVNSFFFTAAATIISTISTTLTAYVLARFRFPGRKLLIALGIGAIVIPDFGSRSVIYKLYTDLGILDTWFILIQYAQPFGLMFLIVFTFFETVPKDYAEAAKIDGAGELRIFWNIYLPMSKGVIGLMMVMNAIGVWNDYYTPYMYLPSLKTLALGIQELSEEAQAVSNFTGLYAGMILAIIPVVTLFVIMHKSIIKNVTIGGIKG